MHKRLGIVAVLATLILGVAVSAPAAAVVGDYDNDGIKDEFDAAPGWAYSEPLDYVHTSNLSATIDGSKTTLPAALYWELNGATVMSVVSADIDSQVVFGTRVYSGPVFITKATVRDLASLDLDAEIMIGLTLNTSAKATKPTGGAFVKGSGICVSIKKVNEIVDSLESASGQQVTLFNLAQVVNDVKDALDNIDIGSCNFTLGVKNGFKLIEILDPNNWFFPGIGSADRVTASIFGGVNFDLTGWRVPLSISLGNLLAFHNGRLSAAAATTSTAATASTDTTPDPTELGTDDAVVTAEETSVDEGGAADLAETTPDEISALEETQLGTTETETTDEEIGELESTVVELASLESTQ